MSNSMKQKIETAENETLRNIIKNPLNIGNAALHNTLSIELILNQETVQEFHTVNSFQNGLTLSLRLCYALVLAAPYGNPSHP